MLDFQLPVSSDKVGIGFIRMRDPENRWLAVGVFFLSIMSRRHFGEGGHTISKYNDIVVIYHVCHFIS